MSHHHEGHDKPGDALQTPAYPGIGHENTDISLKPLVIFVVAMVVSIAVVMFILLKQFDYYISTQSSGQKTPILQVLPVLTDGPPAEPVIQKDPEVDMDTLRKEDAGRLTELSWIDREKGIARIPIDDAMKIVVQKGLPVRKTAETPSAAAKSKGEK